MPTERNSKSNSTSPNINANTNTLNNRQRISSSSTTYPLGISFLSTSATLNESEDMAYIEKRTAHNALERQRREGLNSKFQELAHVLPSLQQVRRPSKSMIVAKSLEFVSNAVERETDFQGQLDALRLENAQLLRQANISKRRMKRQLESDNLPNTIISIKKNKKLSSHTTSNPLSIVSKESNSNKPASIMKSKKLPSKMKPQLRQSSMPISNTSSSQITNKLSPPPSLSSIKHKVDALNSNVSSSSSGTTRRKKRSREDVAQETEKAPINTEYPTTNNAQPASTSPTSVPVVEDKTSQSPPNLQLEASTKRRRLTTETSTNNSNTTVNGNVVYHSLIPDLNYLHYDNTANTDALDSLISSRNSSRQNSITTTMNSLPVMFNNNVNSPNNTEIGDSNEPPAAVVPSQFDVATTSTSPFGNEHTFFNTFENLEHVVSTIPALRTPIGRNNNTVSITSSATSNNNHLPSYDPTTLDIFNSLMQDTHSTTNDSGYYWH
ncbi:unnamed protein product [Mucor hiemalis]